MLSYSIHCIHINGTTFLVLRRVCNHFILGHCIMIMNSHNKVIRKKVFGRKVLRKKSSKKGLTNLYKCRCVCQIWASSSLSISVHSSTGLNFNHLEQAHRLHRLLALIHSEAEQAYCVPARHATVPCNVFWLTSNSHCCIKGLSFKLLKKYSNFKHKT